MKDNMTFEAKVAEIQNRYEDVISKKNEKTDFYNGIYCRYKNPVLTRDHIPPFWKFDFNKETNPFFLPEPGQKEQERLQTLVISIYARSSIGHRFPGVLPQNFLSQMEKQNELCHHRDDPGNRIGIKENMNINKK